MLMDRNGLSERRACWAVDEFTREALVVLCERAVGADEIVARLDRIVAETGRVPTFTRCNNEPELTANALRDRCSFLGAGSAHIEPGSRWQQPYVESFGSRIGDELLAVEQFSSRAEAKVIVVDSRERGPHSALGMVAPATSARGPKRTAAGRPRGPPRRLR